MRQPLVRFSSLLCREDITAVFPLQGASRRKEQTGTQVSPLAHGGWTQVISS